MVNKKICLVIFSILFFVSLGFSAEKKFTQKLQWKSDKNAFEYKVEIVPESGGKSTFFTTGENVIEFSMPSGKYKYRIYAYDFLGRESSVTPWQKFEILKALTPEVSVPKLAETPKEKDKNFSMDVDIKNIAEDTKVELINSETKEIVKGTLSIEKNADEVKAAKADFPSVKEGNWKLRVTNPSGLSSESEEIKVSDSETIAAIKAEEKRKAEAEAERIRIAEEKKKAEEAEKARIAEEKRLAEIERQKQEKLAEEKRIAEEKARKEKELAEAAKRAEEERLAKEAEEKRKAEAEAERIRIAEEKKKAEEAEKARRAEEERLAEIERQKQEKLAEEKRIAEEKARKEREAQEEAERLEQEKIRKNLEQIEREMEEKRLAKLAEEDKQKQYEEWEKSIKIEEELRIKEEEEAEVQRIAQEKAEALAKKKQERKENRDFSMLLGGGIVTPFMDNGIFNYSYTKLVPQGQLRIADLPLKTKKKGFKFGVEMVLQGDLFLNDNDFITLIMPAAEFKLNLVAHIGIIPNKLYVGVKVGGNLTGIFEILSYKDITSGRTADKKLFIYPGAQAGLSIIWIPARHFMIEGGADMGYLFMPDTQSIMIEPYIGVGIRF